jgi:hypothetical protein
MSIIYVILGQEETLKAISGQNMHTKMYLSALVMQQKYGDKFCKISH